MRNLRARRKVLGNHRLAGIKFMGRRIKYRVTRAKKQTVQLISDVHFLWNKHKNWRGGWKVEAAADCVALTALKMIRNGLECRIVDGLDTCRDGYVFKLRVIGRKMLGSISGYLIRVTATVQEHTGKAMKLVKKNFTFDIIVSPSSEYQEEAY